MKLDELQEAQRRVANMKPYEIYVDMDGVLVNFLKGIEGKLGHKHSENEYNNDKAYRNRFWKAVLKDEDFWFHLSPMEDMKQLWNYVKKHDPEILTAVGSSKSDHARAQKKKWINKHIGSGIKVNSTIHGSEKGPQFGGKDKILIDDQPKSIKPWRAAGGIGILHKSAADTIKQLKKLGL